MSELGLILGIEGAGLIFALLLGRWLVQRDAGSLALRRLGGALERATSSLLWREYRLVALLTLGLAALLIASAGRWTLGARFSTTESVVFSMLALLLGLASACLSAHAAASLALRASVRAAAAAEASSDRALSVAIRAGGASAIFGDSLSVLGVVSVFGLVLSVKGGFSGPPELLAELVVQAAGTLPAFALGAAAASLIIQRTGGTYHAAGDVGGDHASEREAGLEHDDARNPAIVTELVGDHVGGVATRAADLFVSSTAANVAAVIVASQLAFSGIVPNAHVMAVVALPLVLRAFGAIGSAFGILVVRGDETQTAISALFRGHVCATVIALSGIAGATYWLLSTKWLPFFAAGTLGLLAAIAASYATRLRLERRSGVVRQSIDALRVGSGTTIATGIGSGLESVIWPTLVLGASALLAWKCGTASQLVGGNKLALVVWTMGTLACSPFVLAVGKVGIIFDTARGIAQMNGANSEAKRRTARLDDAGFIAAAVAQTHLILVGALSALLVATAISAIARPAGSGASGMLYSPALLWSGAIGAALVCFYAGSAARAAARAAREVALEVERQLQGFPREQGVSQIPPDYTPSYKSCVEVAEVSALRRVLIPVGFALLVPIALGIGLGLMYRSEGPGLVAESLASFVVMASLTGLGAALAIDGARTALGKVRRAIRPRDGSAGFSASVSADALADILGNSAGPAAQLLVKAAAVTALAMTLFLL